MRPLHILGWSVALLQFCLLLFVGDVQVSAAPAPQESKFEVPVQLIGFPVIIMAVRMSNFVKKLAYSLNPRTYKSRSRRSLSDALAHSADVDAAAVEKKLVKEMGERVCVYETVCGEYAKRAHQLHGGEHKLDWPELIRHYEESPEGRKEFYLLSVFLGDIVASPRLCHQLATRGRSCK